MICRQCSSDPGNLRATAETAEKTAVHVVGEREKTHAAVA